MNRTSVAVSAGAAAAAAIAIIAASWFSLPLVTITVGIASVIAAFGWPALLSVPARKSLSAAIGLSALLAVVLTATVGSTSYLAWFPGAVALGVGAVFLIQLIRGTGQSHRLESTFGASSGVLAVAMGAGWVAATRLSAGVDPGMLLVSGPSLLIALAVCLLPLPDRIVIPAALGLAALTGALGALLFTDVPALVAGVVGLACGTVLAGTRRLLVARPAVLSVPAALSVGVTPVLALGSVVYFLDKLLLT